MSRWHVAVAVAADMVAVVEAMVGGGAIRRWRGGGTGGGGDPGGGNGGAGPPSAVGVGGGGVLRAGPWAGAECPVERFGGIAGPSAGAPWEAAWPLAERSAGTRPVLSARGAREGCGRRSRRTEAASGPQDRPSPVAPEWARISAVV